MSVGIIQPSFAGGEFAPAMFGRVDFAKYHIGLSTMRNGFVGLRGGFYSRAGTAFCGFSKQTGRTVAPRLVPFQFSINQGIAIEAGNEYFRFLVGGSFVTENPTTIQAITQANPGVVTDNAHGYSNGDWVFLQIQGMTQLNGRVLIAQNVTANTYTLTDVYGNAIDTALYTAFASGTAARIYTLPTPYAEADIEWLKWTQSADVMTVCCWNQLTGTEYAPYDLARDADDAWVLTAYAPSSSIAAPATCSGAYTVRYGGSASPKPTDYQYCVTAVDLLTGQESVASPIADIPDSADIAITAGSINLNWSAVAGAGSYNVYKAPPAYASDVPAGALFGYAATTFGTSAVDSNIVADYSQVPPLHENPFAPGQILYAVVTNTGNGLKAVTYTFDTATGIDAVGYPVIVNGQMTAFIFTNHGALFQPGDSIVFNGAGFASGAVDFTSSGNPVNGDTITLNGVLWTFVSSATPGNTTLIQDNVGDTMIQLASDLSASTNPLLTVANYVSGATQLFITYATAGPGGDAYTLAASADISPGVSGGTLTGGSGTSGADATGTLTFTVNPTNGQTIVLDGQTWTFVTSGASGQQTNIGVNLAATLTQLAVDLNASGNLAIKTSTYVASATVLTITYKTAGTVGNSYTLNGGTSGATPSGPTLTGGVNGPVAPSATLVIGPQTGTYPSVPGYFQERRVYASSPNQPDTYWMTQPGAFNNLDSRVPTVDSDAITGTPWSVEVNGIQWMVSMPGGLVVLTGLEAWQLTGAGGSSLNPQPITPASQQAQPQAYNGISPKIPPIKIDYDINYVQAKGSIWRDLSYNFWANIYTGTDLTYLSPHLFQGFDMVQAAWCEEPFRLIWCVRSDGVLLSLTYFKQQDVMGWARHDTNGLFLSVCSVTEPPVDALYIAAQRPLPQGTAYTIERMDNRMWPANENAWCVDCGLQTTLTEPAATLTASAATGNGVVFTASPAVFSAASVGQVIRIGGGRALVTVYTDTEHVTGNIITPIVETYPNSGGVPIPAASGDWSIAPQITTVSGLWHLVGQTVTGVADGVPIAPQVVNANGQIVLAAPASLVTVGEFFLPQMQTLYLDAGNPTQQGRRGILKNVTVRIESSNVSTILVGSNQPDGSVQSPPVIEGAWNASPANPMTPLYLPPSQNVPLPGQSQPPLWTGDARVPVSGGVDKRKQTAIMQTAPLPLQVLAVIPELLPADTPQTGGGEGGGGQDVPGKKQTAWAPGPASLRRAA